jgi:outer membrane protein assembly factor BamA
MKCKFAVLSLFYVLLAITAVAQEKDSTKGYRKYDLLPAISYAPETGLTLGIIGYRYLRLGKKYPTRQSNIDFVAVYTTRNQIIVESNWDIFTDGDKFRFRGFAGYNLYPDRNYGLGNNASAFIREYELDNALKTDSTDLNYLNFSIQRITFKPVFLMKLRDKIYGGVRFDLEYQYAMKIIPDQYTFLREGSAISLMQNNNSGVRSGVGLALVYDSRDNILNARNGIFIDYSALFYGKLLGSDYTYSYTRIDARKYFNPVKNHSIALRANFIFSRTDEMVIPMRGLARVGGHDFMRGYFRGTFQDKNLASFEAEYRLPFWSDDVDAPLYKIWKRLGMVAFVSGAQVYGYSGNFAFDKFNYAAGTGLRVLFNPESRVNIRIDYSWGLSKDSAGPGSRQTGLYFFLSEAF